MTTNIGISPQDIGQLLKEMRYVDVGVSSLSEVEINDMNNWTRCDYCLLFSEKVVIDGNDYYVETSVWTEESNIWYYVEVFQKNEGFVDCKSCYDIDDMFKYLEKHDFLYKEPPLIKKAIKK